MTAVRFELIPAIDLLGGECVRLAQGDYAAATVYEADPAAAARRFAAHAVPRLHVVDLDGARAGRPINTRAIRAIAAAVARKDSKTASQLMSAHILGAGHSLVRFLQEQRGAAAPAAASVAQ